MSFAMNFREQLQGVSGWIVEEFDQTLASVQAFLGVEHREDGTHGDITPTSLSSGSSDGLLQVDSGIRYNIGPWVFDDDGNRDFTAVIDPPQITANQNDYDTPGLATAIGVHITTDAARTITGLKQVSDRKRMLLLVNRGNFTITLSHASGSSTAAYQFSVPGGADYSLVSGECVWLYYDPGSDVWRLMAKMSAIKSVQEGSTRIDTGLNSNTTAITAVVVAKSYVFPREHGSHGIMGATDTGARPSLSNSTTVTVTRDTSNADILHYWTVVEFN